MLPAVAVAIVARFVVDLRDRPAEYLGEVGDQRPVLNGPRSLPYSPDAGPARYGVELCAGVNEQSDLGCDFGPVAAAWIVRAEQDSCPLSEQVRVGAGQSPQ
jgi:hypothetical protein